MRKKLTIRSSSLPQLMVCSPSVLNPQQWPEVENYVGPAELGTLMHDFAQRIVETGEFKLDEVHAKFPEEKERAALIANNFLTVWDEAKLAMPSPIAELSHEANLVDMDDLELTLTGHIDLVQLYPDSAFILDYKTGRGHENHYHQIAGYAFLLWDKVGRPDKFDVKVAVVYLEDITVQNYTFTPDDLRKWNRDVVAKVRDPRYVVSRKCGVCRIASSCEVNKADREDTMTYLSGKAAQNGAVSWMKMDPAERGKLVDKLYVVKKGLERVEISLRSAMQGNTDVDRLDIGKGMVYEKTVRKIKTLDTAKALPLLLARFDPELIEGIIKLDLDDVLALAASYAAKGTKGKVKDELFAKLSAAGAVVITEQERFQRRPVDEVKFTKGS